MKHMLKLNIPSRTVQTKEFNKSDTGLLGALNDQLKALQTLLENTRGEKNNETKMHGKIEKAE